MVSVKLSCLLYTIVSVFSVVKALVDPTETYDGGFGKSDVLLRIATGGAGQSGLVRGNSQCTAGEMPLLTGSTVLSDAFIKERVSQGRKPFSIGWVRHNFVALVYDYFRPEDCIGPQRHNIYNQKFGHR